MARSSAAYYGHMDAIALRHLRQRPLEAVLEGFGARRDRKDPRRNWRVGDSRITLTGERFFDHQHEVGGGGAIDLTLYLMGRDPRHPTAADLLDAARWLGAGEWATQAASVAAASPPRSERTVFEPSSPMPRASRACAGT